MSFTGKDACHSGRLLACAPMLRKALREAAVVAFYFALAAAMTWPLLRQLPTAVADLGDPLVNMWIVDWVGHALTHAPLSLFESPLYFPGHLTLAYSENLVGVTLFVLPFQLAGMHPVAVYNLALLLGFAWSGYGAFVLARLITRSAAASLVAGVVFAFVPFKFDHLSHMQLLWSGWIPLLLAAVLAYWQRPSRRTAALVAGAFLMNGITNVHYFLFGSFTAVAAVLVLAVIQPRSGRRFWGGLVAAFAIGGLLLLPFLLPYRIVSKELAYVRGEADAISGSAPLAAWLAATPRNIVYGDLGPGELHRHEMQLFPGLVALFLALIGAAYTTGNATPRLPGRLSGPGLRFRRLDLLIALLGVLTYIGAATTWTELRLFGMRLLTLDSADVPATLLLLVLIIRFRRELRDAAARSRFPAGAWVAAVAIVIGFLGSLGMSTFFHTFLFRRVELFRAVRAPVRWAVIAYAGLAVWAAIGVLAILQRQQGRRRTAMAAMLIAVAALDLWPHIRWEQSIAAVEPVYRWLATERVAPIVEFPSSGAGGAPFRYLLGSATHHLPQFNGVENVGTAAFKTIRTKSDANQYDDALLDVLERNGCRLVIVHAHSMPDEARTWLRNELAARRLAFIRRFDHDIGGDFVFAVTHNLPDWQRLRAADAPDGAGLLPDQELARMLAGQPTHSDAIMTYVESPQERETITGPLRISGWTLSPFGIRRVTARLDGGRLRIDVPLHDRADVKATYSWYYFVPKPGFTLLVPKRPANIPRATDVQIEVEDHQGRVMRSTDVLIDWDS